MAAAARARAERDFGWDRSVALLRDVYRSLRPPAAASFIPRPTEEEPDVRSAEGPKVAVA
jgi:hypothetical protein